MNKDRVQELLVELSDLFARKNSDYGANEDPWSNFREAERFGVTPFIGCLIRKGDKWRRIQNLLKKGEANRAVKDESLVDTLKDDVVYGIIAICLYEEDVLRMREKAQEIVSKSHSEPYVVKGQ